MDLLIYSFSSHTQPRVLAREFSTRIWYRVVLLYKSIYTHTRTRICVYIKVGKAINCTSHPAVTIDDRHHPFVSCTSTLSCIRQAKYIRSYQLHTYTQPVHTERERESHPSIHLYTCVSAKKTNGSDSERVKAREEVLCAVCVHARFMCSQKCVCVSPSIYLYVCMYENARVCVFCAHKMKSDRL